MKRDYNRHYNKWFLSTVKQTIIRYGMITAGDKLAIGVSGGKDSSALLYILSLVQDHAPFSFSLQAVFVEMGWQVDIAPMENLCRRLHIPLHVERTAIARIVFEVRKEKNPCSLCAKMRRGALHHAAQNLGCNKVALGHHLDDAMETFFLNIIFSGRLDTFKPFTYLDRRDLKLIRPLICIPEKTLATLCRLEDLPLVPNPCPVAGRTKRHDMGEIVDFLLSRYPRSYQRFITAMEKSHFWKL
ncbi:MAG: tRNA 2-thiocytidine biosynthesis TtcA family protein [Bacillota bacterium]